MINIINNRFTSIEYDNLPDAPQLAASTTHSKKRLASEALQDDILDEVEVLAEYLQRHCGLYSSAIALRPIASPLKKRKISPTQPITQKRLSQISRYERPEAILRWMCGIIRTFKSTTHTYLV